MFDYLAARCGKVWALPEPNDHQRLHANVDSRHWSLAHGKSICQLRVARSWQTRDKNQILENARARTQCEHINLPDCTACRCAPLVDIS